MATTDRERYVESLAADLYWAGEQWFSRVDPYHAWSPKWFALREERKQPYRELAKKLIENDSKVENDVVA